MLVLALGLVSGAGWKLFWWSGLLLLFDSGPLVGLAAEGPSGTSNGHHITPKVIPIMLVLHGERA